MKLTRSTIAFSVGAAGVVIAVILAPRLLGSRVSDAIDALQGADSGWLVVSAALFGAAFLATVGGWRAALAASGGQICPRQAAARIGVGSLVNSFAPAKLGDAVKIALCSKAIDGPDRLWTAGGVYTALGAARLLTLALLVVAGSATGALPLWPVFVLCGVVVALGTVALSSSRWRKHHRISHLLEGFAALERSPRDGIAVLGWMAAGLAARLGATVAVALALGFPDPLLAALVILPAIDLASAIPVGLGNVGVASGAVAVALQSRGIGVSDAIGAGIAIQALETAVSLTAGTIGGLYLVQPSPAVRRWTLRTAAVGVSIALAAAVGFVFFDVV